MPAVWSRAFIPLALILMGGLAMRVAAIAAGAGYPFDIVTFQRWAARMAAGGPPAFYDPALFADYPPGLLYLLWPLGFWPGGPPGWALRAISIPFDLAIAVVLFMVVARLRGSRDGLVGAALYALNPALALAGPFWGQVDALAMLPLLLSLVAAAAGRHALAGSLAALAALVKPQVAIGLGVLVLAALAAAAKRGEWRPLLVTIGAAMLTTAIVFVPFAPTPEKAAGLIRDVTAPHPFSSLFAFNIWALATGFAISDDTPLLGVPIRLWGAIFLSTAIVLIVARLWSLVPRGPRASGFARDLATLLAITTLVAIAVYELPTRIHERYLFAVFPVLAPFVGLSKRATAAYVIFSVALTVSVLFAFTHQEQTGVRAPEFIERTLFDPSVLILLILAGLGVTAALVTLWWRREPALTRSLDTDS